MWAKFLVVVEFKDENSNIVVAVKIRENDYRIDDPDNTRKTFYFYNNEKDAKKKYFELQSMVGKFFLDN